jgi:hypothetical protein
MLSDQSLSNVAQEGGPGKNLRRSEVQQVAAAETEMCALIYTFLHNDPNLYLYTDI